MCCDPWLTTDTPDFLAVGQHLRASGVQVPRVYGISPAGTDLPGGLWRFDPGGVLAHCLGSKPCALGLSRYR